jgi:NADH:ubiquinone oxidoreductase subunit 4 (subunit M)
MQFPILSVIVFAPLVVAVILLLMKPERKTEVRVTALAAAIFDLVLSAWVYWQVYINPSLEYQFV